MVGYAGGTAVNPSYHNLGDHTETIKIVYNSNVISYGELLNIFWGSHDPIYRTRRQYMSIVFYHDDVQKQEAIEVKKEFESKKGHTLYTEIKPFKNFYPAERYHQKYYLRTVTKLYEKLRSMYSSFDEFVSSTLVARVNGYIARRINMSSLKDELEHLEISEEDYNKIIFALEELGR